MDIIRKERMLRDLASRYRDARARTDDIPEESWEIMKSAGLEAMLIQMSKLSTMSREYRQMQEAVVLLYPHLEAWKRIGPYRAEILEADEEEQDELRAAAICTIAAETRISESEAEKNAYAFWPVPINA